MILRRINNAFGGSAGGGRALCLLLMGAVVLLANPFARAANNLIAHASDDTLWIAVVRPPDSKTGTEETTTIRYRSINTADQTWRELPTYLGRVSQMAHLGDSLVVLMSTGEWDTIWPSGDSMGPSLPDRSRILAIASDRDQIYAVGMPGVEAAPATQAADSVTTAPTTSETAAATSQPTTRPQLAMDRPILYLFDQGHWKAIANCPQAATTGDVSLAIVDRQPMVAQIEKGAIGVYELNDDKAWLALDKIAMSATPTAIKLLSGTQRPTLWVDTGPPGGTLYLGGKTWEKPIALSPSSPIQHAADRTVVEAAGNIRLFVTTEDKSKVYEQRFDAAGQRNGNVAQLETPEGLSEPMLEAWPMIVLMVALAFLMLSSIRRQGPETPNQAARTEQPGTESLVLAPSGQRLLGALIDAIPLIVAVVYVLNGVEDPFDPAAVWLTVPPLVIAMVIYLLHTALTEIFAGRSLGKMIVGLRVVTTDGQPPRAWAMLVRNLLRVIDIVPLPLGAMVLLTPLRQRIGDMAARTVVITTTEPVGEDEAEHSK